MRCPDCNKFVGYDEMDPELSVELDGESITGECRVALACSECGQELKEYTFDVDVDVSADHSCSAVEPEDGWPEDEAQFELVSEGANFLAEQQTEYYDRKAKKYRKVTNPRYAKTFYGADMEFEVRCLWCQETFTVMDSVKEQASAFDELV